MKANPDGTKRCPKCGETKRVGEFSRYRQALDGLKCQCKACHKAYMREYHQRPDVKVRYRVADKARRRMNRESREHRERHRATDRGTRLNNYMRFWVFHSLGRTGYSWRWELLVGYTIDDLIAHLETHFTDGMSWENLGEWEVEHVVPRKEFEYTSAEDSSFRECWALSNLRPGWR